MDPSRYLGGGHGPIQAPSAIGWPMPIAFVACPFPVAGAIGLVGFYQRAYEQARAAARRGWHERAVAVPN